jgi:hypothetical protein
VSEIAATDPAPTPSAAPKPSPGRGRACNLALIVGFVLVLLAPTVAKALRCEPWEKMDEKRELAKQPALPRWSREAFAKLPAFAQGWERYFNDHFGLRKLLVGSYRLAAVHGFRQSLNPSVVIGKSDGKQRWLYFDPVADNNGISFDSFLGKRPYRPADLGKIAQQLRQLTAAVRATGAKLVILVAPDKQTIYPEYLPASRRRTPGVPSRLEQFWAMATSLPDVPLVDMRGPLLREKATQQLYYPADTHWNWRAGALAYQAVAAALAAQDPGFRPLPLGRLSWQLGDPRNGDLSQLMGMPPLGGDLDWLPPLGDLPALVDAKHGKLLVAGDSFFELVLPFLAPQFDHVQKLYTTLGIRTALLAPGLLAKAAPDVVVVASVERFWTLE